MIRTPNLLRSNNLPTLFQRWIGYKRGRHLFLPALSLPTFAPALDRIRGKRSEILNKFKIVCASFRPVLAETTFSSQRATCIVSAAIHYVLPGFWLTLDSVDPSSVSLLLKYTIDTRSTGSFHSQGNSRIRYTWTLGYR
ncbi:hypothetical protein L209DRAFT_464118 [Thermothelomyces heterothallicus CBS 203.75]